VGKGNVDLGITGHDVILEAQMQNLVTEELRLGFGKCALQVQVPEAGPIKSVEQLGGRRVVTSFEVLSGEYFGKLDAQLNLVGEAKTKIEYVGGSVEAACALGLADGIGEFTSISPLLIVMTTSRTVDLVGMRIAAFYIRSSFTTLQNPETQCARQVCTQ
jgi:ATP phosphoribosyltransferase